MKQPFLEAGRVLTTHGIAGELKFEPWGDSPQDLSDVNELFLDPAGTAQLYLTSKRPQGRFLLLRIQGYDDVEHAQALRGKTLYVRRSDLPFDDSTVFFADLFGLRVRDANTHRDYGVIRDVYNRGASDLWEIEKDGIITLFAAAKPFIVSIDPEKEALITPPDGLFAPEEH